MMIGEERWMTAFALNSYNDHLILTNEDLAKLGNGVESSFVVALISYKDRGTLHHARRCVWLQAPAEPPGVWHFCEVFNNSD